MVSESYSWFTMRYDISQAGTFMYTQLNAVVIVGHVRRVQIRTGGVLKCRSLQVVAYGMVNCRERSRSCTPGVQCATGPPR